MKTDLVDVINKIPIQDNAIGKKIALFSEFNFLDLEEVIEVAGIVKVEVEVEVEVGDEVGEEVGDESSILFPMMFLDVSLWMSIDVFSSCIFSIDSALQ